MKLAIIDTCVEGNHDELQGSIASSFNAAGPASGNCKPENHGTAVASLIAGHGKLHGTAERAALLSAQAFSFTSEENEIAATSREIALSMDWAAQTGAQVMNLSFAGPADPLIERMVAAAYRKNIGLIAAAGNAGPYLSAALPGCLSRGDRGYGNEREAGDLWRGEPRQIHFRVGARRGCARRACQQYLRHRVGNVLRRG